MPPWLRAQQEMLASLMVTSPPPEPKAMDHALHQAAVLRERPARRIDNALRARARAAVQRARECRAGCE